MNRTDTHLRTLLTVCFVAWAVPAWCQMPGPYRTAVRVPVPRQDSNPYGDADYRMAPLTLNSTGFSSHPVVERPPIAEHDLVTVLVDETASVSSEGEIDRRKKADSQASLKDWIGLRGMAIVPDPQTLGDPTVGAEQDKKYRAEGGLETSESIKFRIQCEVVDIRANGLLLLEGRRRYKINAETWETYYMGWFRPDDIMPDNTVESIHAFNPIIDKREAGSVRDGYRLGWLQKFMDRYQF